MLQTWKLVHTLSWRQLIKCGEKIQGAPSPTSKAVKWYWILNMLLVFLAGRSASKRHTPLMPPTELTMVAKVL